MRHDKAIVAQSLQRLADHWTRCAQHRRQALFGWQPLVKRETAIADHADDLLVHDVAQPRLAPGGSGCCQIIHLRPLVANR